MRPNAEANERYHGSWGNFIFEVGAVVWVLGLRCGLGGGFFTLVIFNP